MLAVFTFLLNFDQVVQSVYAHFVCHAKYVYTAHSISALGLGQSGYTLDPYDFGDSSESGAETPEKDEAGKIADGTKTPDPTTGT